MTPPIQTDRQAAAAQLDRVDIELDRLTELLMRCGPDPRLDLKLTKLNNDSTAMRRELTAKGGRHD